MSDERRDNEHWPEAPTEEVDDGTVVVRRAAAGPSDDGTIAIERGGDDATVAVERRGNAATAHTVVRDRAGSAAPGGFAGAPNTAPPTRRRDRRRQIALPPGEPGRREAVAAPGPGAVAPYLPRAVPEPPPSSSALEPAGADARADVNGLRSVIRHSRRTAALALAAVAAITLASATGIVAVIVALVA